MTTQMIHISPGDTGGRLDDGNPKRYKPQNVTNLKNIIFHAISDPVARAGSSTRARLVPRPCQPFICILKSLGLDVQLVLVHLSENQLKMMAIGSDSDVGGQCRAAGSHSRSIFLPQAVSVRPGILSPLSPTNPKKNEFHFIFLTKFFSKFSVAVSWI